MAVYFYLLRQNEAWGSTKRAGLRNDSYYKQQHAEEVRGLLVQFVQ